ncbi:MAG: ParB N-terminal domain-containing protein [Candidatus Falkowbacteria bacterium]|nr:ParB N-terminal domain-containing protein [Candidatus Falkowbacteria bacterium]
MTNKNLEIIMVKADLLKPSEYNPRKWSEDAICQLTESIKRFGLVDPIICNSAPARNNVVIGGHFRLKIAKNLGYQEVPVVYINIPNIEREEELITELLKILDKININELGMRQKLEDEIPRFNIFRRSVLGSTDKIKNTEDTDIRNYAKYILKEGSTSEKRELLGNLRSRIIYKDKTLTLLKE